MIINNAPQNEAVLSNVGEIGEFRIRNSSKAFSILSSGLYANKIRAIVRELSCNAVDSHVAAGKADTPFDVHMPNALEPWFAIRDYGTGLNADQVANIYTTYFESTKTNSNDFIGALGLGSKSPFSYTDNFTITAIKDGIKGIYSAFINEAGVPSIAAMSSEASDEPAGVEIKFSVNDQYDFNKFRNEAQYVYTYFKLRPVVSGCTDFNIREIKYEKKDIVPGISTLGEREGRSVAVMGNIPYPIEVPNEQQNLGELAGLLHCGLEIQFAIGEVDFQASREGLSYIPQTISSIKAKLEQLNAALAIVVAKEGNAIENKWDRAEWILAKLAHQMWRAPVAKYLKDTKFKLVDLNDNRGYYSRVHEFKVQVKRLAEKFNIAMGAFQKYDGYNTCSEHYTQHDYDPKDRSKTLEFWSIPVSNNTYFVITDTKVGALARAKHHWKVAPPKFKSEYGHRGHSNHTVFVLSAADPTKEMNTDAFFRLLSNPRTDRILKASELTVKERKKGSVMGKDVTILSLQNRNKTYRDTEMVWRDAGKADKFDASVTYYYLPLKGFYVEDNGIKINDTKEFYADVAGSGIGLKDFTLYGVRKTDIEFIKTQKNWINIQTHLGDVFGKMTKNFMVGCIAKGLDLKTAFVYNEAVAKLINQKSPYAKFTNWTKKMPTEGFRKDGFKRIAAQYSKQLDHTNVTTSFKAELEDIRGRYKLLDCLPPKDRLNVVAVAEYVNLIDSQTKEEK